MAQDGKLFEQCAILDPIYDKYRTSIGYCLRRGNKIEANDCVTRAYDVAIESVSQIRKQPFGGASGHYLAFHYANPMSGFINRPTVLQWLAQTVPKEL